MKKYINDRSSNAFCSQLQSLKTSHINVKMSQDNSQNELDRAIASILQSGIEDQPFDLEAFFAPLPDSIINVWDAEEARQARLDAEEQQIRQANDYTTIWAGRNLHTPVLEIPSEEPIVRPQENIIAATAPVSTLDNGFVNLWAGRTPVLELPSEGPIAIAQENIIAAAAPVST